MTQIRYVKNLSRVIAALFLVVLSAPLLPGCGGSSGAADAYIKKGDEIKAELDEASERLAERIEKMFSVLYKELSKSLEPDLAGFENSAGKVKALAADMSVEARKARKAYERVMELDNVPDHQEYAKLSIEMIDSNTAGLEQLTAFLDECGKRLSARSFDAYAFQSYVSEFGNTLEVQGDKAGQLQLKLESLKNKL